MSNQVIVLIVLILILVFVYFPRTSPNASSDIRLGPLIPGVCEEEIGGAKLGQDAGSVAIRGKFVKHEACRHIADARACCMLWVTMTIV